MLRIFENFDVILTRNKDTLLGNKRRSIYSDADTCSSSLKSPVSRRSERISKKKFEEDIRKVKNEKSLKKLRKKTSNIKAKVKILYI
jgi:hypothetical protein